MGDDGHMRDDKELSSEEGEELLRLRKDNRRMRAALEQLVAHAAAFEDRLVMRVAKWGMGDE